MIEKKGYLLHFKDKNGEWKSQFVSDEKIATATDYDKSREYASEVVNMTGREILAMNRSQNELQR